MLASLTITGIVLITWLKELLAALSLTGARTRAIAKRVTASLRSWAEAVRRKSGSYAGTGIMLKYVEGGTIYQQELSYVSLKGFNEPDNMQFFPPTTYRFIDGSSRTQFKGFRRVITINFGVVESITARRFVNRFLLSNERTISIFTRGLGGEEMFITPADETYETIWVENTSIFRKIELNVLEKTIRTAWTSYTPPSTWDIMYIKNKVKIEGTQSAPESFSTNSGKLATMETGETFPSISLLSYVVTVICNGTPYQDAKINQVGSVTNTGTDLTFSLAVSDAGNPSSDGYFYADIIIGLQARP